MIGEGRYLRQSVVFPEDRRRATFVADLCGEAAPDVSLFLKAGAGATGIRRIASDFHGWGDGGHWLAAGHERMLAAVNDEAEYGYIDPEAAAFDLGRQLRGQHNAWVVVHLNEPARAREVLSELVGLDGLRVLLVLAAPAGVVVERAPDPGAALERVRGIERRGAIPPGPAELAILAAGQCLNEVVLAGVSGRDDLTAPRTVGFYDLHRRRRVDAPPDAGLGELVADVAAPIGDRAAFSGRAVKQVGAGALGNFAAIAIALDGRVAMEVVDGDATIEAHNLNRQILLVGGLGREKAPVLAEELGRLDPAGAYSSDVRFVEDKSDLGQLDGLAAVVAAPDNDAARATCAEAAWEAGVLFGQGGTGATGGQETVHEQGRACFRCVMGQRAGAASGGNSCSRVQADSVVSSNMVVGGLLVSELREALSGRRSCNVRFVGDSASGNRLGRMLSDVACPHVAPVCVGSD